MTRSELNEECVKHGTCKGCKYGELASYGEWNCSISRYDLEGDDD